MACCSSRSFFCFASNKASKILVSFMRSKPPKEGMATFAEPMGRGGNVNDATGGIMNWFKAEVTGAATTTPAAVTRAQFD
eukprot:scaffold39232_cov145-Amphora_coffeaeformis.AAC.2